MQALRYASFKPIMQSAFYGYTSGEGVNSTCNDDNIIKSAKAGTYTAISSPGAVVTQPENTEAGMMTVSTYTHTHQRHAGLP